MSSWYIAIAWKVITYFKGRLLHWVCLKTKIYYLKNHPVKEVGSDGFSFFQQFLLTEPK